MNAIWYLFKGLSYAGAALFAAIVLLMCGGLLGWWG